MKSSFEDTNLILGNFLRCCKDGEEKGGGE